LALSLAQLSKETVTDKVFFGISINGEEKGEIEIGLFGKVVPKTVNNFATLCSGE